MTDIKISYTQNTKGKVYFVALQNGEILYEKTYSPIKSKNQHLMSKALIDVFNIQVEKELAVNPNFIWESFEDFKAWAITPEMVVQAVKLYKERALEAVKEVNK